MKNPKSTLPINFIGKIIGRRQLVLSNDRLILEGKHAAISTVSLEKCSLFATCSQGFLGGNISIFSENNSYKFQFLKKKTLEAFTTCINQNIAILLSKRLSSITKQLQKQIIQEYPRDSRIKNITALCAYLHQTYLTQPDLYQQYLPIELIQDIQKWISFYPVTPEKLWQHHEAIQLKAREQFFNQVESNPLTQEQRLAVLRSNDRNMVLAAAGTGKTSIMIAKALDLIDRKLADPEEILLLAYNKSAAQELSKRLEEKMHNAGISLNQTPKISTFHALGVSILRHAGIPTNISKFAEDNTLLGQWVTAWLEKYLLLNRQQLLNFIELTPTPVNPLDFKDKAEYERYVRDNELRTLQAEKVRGYEELRIANFLFLNGIKYEYEATYVSKKRIEIGLYYRPDFHITDTNIYIEHFGIDRNGKTRPDINARKYNNDIFWKREVHKRFNTKLIETFHYEWTEKTLFEKLKTQLLKYDIACNPIPNSEVFKKLKDVGYINRWTELLKKALQAIRTEQLDHRGILHRLQKSSIYRAEEIATLLNQLHQDYIQELQNQKTIDFDDMIIQTTATLEKEKFTPKWRYVLVDEFQDISMARMDLVKAILRKGPDPSLTVVGDDWQSIYRFSGGKLELTTRFNEAIGHHTLTKLQKTFRYNNSIADTAGRFIMENPEQFKKEIQTHTQVSQSQIYLLDSQIDQSDKPLVQLDAVIKKIRENDQTGSIAIIARYNRLLKDAKECIQGNNIVFLTFHKSKGLEADYVVLVGFSQGPTGFPNENRDNEIIEALLPSIDGFPHSEERRLMYVGITRAKKKLYIIADSSAPSQFITELISPKYRLNIAAKSFQNQYRAIFKCPYCQDGYFKKVKGQYGDFYKCSTEEGCLVGKAKTCPQCHSPLIETETTLVCNNPSCHYAEKICPKCGRPLRKRKGKYGTFWGCSGYGIIDDQCKYTEHFLEEEKSAKETKEVAIPF